MEQTFAITLGELFQRKRPAIPSIYPAAGFKCVGQAAPEHEGLNL